MKILVIHATAGAGHKKAAEAIFDGLSSTPHYARLIDALDFTNPFFKVTYPSCYAFLVTRLPWLWAMFFSLLDLPFMQPFVRIARRIYNGLNAKKLEEFLIQEKFDVIITTQFLSAEVSAHLKHTKKISSKVICVVTDFDVHRIWVNKGIDAYAVASLYTRDKIISLGVPQNNVFVTGIPTHSKFSQPVDVSKLKMTLGLKEDLFTVLIATGSFGMGPIEELIDGLKGYQLLVVCGHNKELFNRLKPKAKNDTHVYGLVNNMDELMSVANVMITKPGGLSIAEALVKNLPMAFFSAIPGQETNNIMVLKKYGAAGDQMTVKEIIKKIDDWSTSSQEFAHIRQNIEILAKPDAVKQIIKTVID